MNKLLKYTSIGFLIGIALSFVLTLSYFIIVQLTPILKSTIQASGYFYQWFVLMFVVGAVIFGIIGIIIGFFKARSKPVRK